MNLIDLVRARSNATGAVIRTRVGEMHARVTGNGPPLVLIHGVTESSETFFELQEALSHLATIHAIDLPGHGYSDIPPNALGLEEMSRWVEAYMEVARIDRAVIAGWSLGGGVALSLAARAPDRVAALVLIGSVGPRMPMPFGLGLLRVPFVAELLVRAARAPGFRRAVLRDVYHRSFTPHEQIIDRHWNAWRVRGRAVYLRSLMRAVEVDSLESCLRDVRAKTIVVHGKNDRLVPFRIGRHLAESIPNAELRALPHTGHAPHLEEPAAVRSAIRAALLHAWA
jgi:pimeloyl-ACP methyl ester carboxylesterase